MGYTPTNHNEPTGSKNARTPLSILAFGGDRVRICLHDAPLASPHSLDTALPRLESALRAFNNLIPGKNFVTYTDNGKIYVAVKNIQPADLFIHLSKSGFRPTVPDEIGAAFIDDVTFNQLARAQRPQTYQEQVPSQQAGIVFTTHSNSLATTR
ncbi:MAG: hypothetical protein EB060_06225 [Proteobacteria bacterium]|nr:hypothetical protein [Pseudomonadota bacterium]